MLVAKNRTEEMKVYVLTKDHKPSEEGEERRILTIGGQIYQYHSPQL